MISYEVRLTRTETVNARATVSVEATSEAEAGAKAIALAGDGKVKWSEQLGEPAVHGEVTVERVDPLVDLDFAEEEIEP